MKYKVKVSDIAPDNINYKEIKDRGFLGISINNPIFLEQKIEFLTDWLYENLSECKIIVGDHLHRINEYILYGENIVNATEKSRKRGALIAEHLTKILHKYNKNRLSLEFWAQYSKDEECQYEREKLKSLYQQNNNFQASINDLATTFIDKQISRGCHIHVNKGKAINFSVKYILEEMSVFSILIKRGYKVQVYPGTQLNILKELAKGKFPEIDTNLKHGIYIDLTVKKIK